MCNGVIFSRSADFGFRPSGLNSILYFSPLRCEPFTIRILPSNNTLSPACISQSSLRIRLLPVRHFLPRKGQFAYASRTPCLAEAGRVYGFSHLRIQRMRSYGGPHRQCYPRVDCSCRTSPTHQQRFNGSSQEVRTWETSGRSSR